MSRRAKKSDKATAAAAVIVKQSAEYLQNNPDAIKKVLKAFPQKLSANSEKITFATGITAMFYAIKDPKTGLKVKALLAAALAYFILPFDVIPDWLAGIGFTDDLAVVLMVLRQVSGSVTEEHYELARRRLQRKQQPPQ